MRPKKQIITLLALFFIVSIALSAYAAPGDYNLSLETTTDGTTEAPSFGKGDLLYLNIVLDNAADVAGAAFTVTYNSSKVTGPATDADGVPVDPAGVTSIFPFSHSSTDTFRANSSETDKIYLAGAAIDETDGGGKYTGGQVILFTIKFQVNGDVAPGNTTFQLVQTELFNLDAGYGTDNDSSGDFTAGDIKGPVPVLVGAVDDTHGDWGGDDLSDDFPDLTPDLIPLPPVLDSLQIGITGCTADTDGDGLCDSVESGSGVYIGPNDTGTDRNKKDTDGDGYSDSVELQNGTDPFIQNDAGGPGYDPSTDIRLGTTVDLTLPAGWSLISLPVTPDDPSLAVLFPDAEAAFSFNGSYQLATTLEPGKGYWVKLATGDTYSITGVNYAQCSLGLTPGWHLVGTINATATPTTDPAGEISAIFGFDGAYSLATELEAGKGYWVEINDNCDFNVDTP